MSYERQPLTGLLGNAGRDPEIKETSKGQVTSFSIAVSDGFGQDANTDWVRVSVWNEGLQEQVQSQVYKGAQVAVQGVLVDDAQYGKQIKNAVRVGLITWLPRSKAQAQPQPQPAEEEVDF